jgi:hypothetical protein
LFAKAQEEANKIGELNSKCIHVKGQVTESLKLSEKLPEKLQMRNRNKKLSAQTSSYLTY